MNKLLAGLAVAAGITTAAAGLATPASARVNIDVYMGSGLYIGPPVSGRLGCRAAADEIWYRGYRSISALDCRGDTYVYQARRKHRWWKIRVSSHNGRILSIR